jgi:hypothetical protein
MVPMMNPDGRAVLDVTIDQGWRYRHEVYDLKDMYLHPGKYIELSVPISMMFPLATYWDHAMNLFKLSGMWDVVFACEYCGLSASKNEKRKDCKTCGAPVFM